MLRRFDALPAVEGHSLQTTVNAQLTMLSEDSVIMNKHYPCRALKVENSSVFLSREVP